MDALSSALSFARHGAHAILATVEAVAHYGKSVLEASEAVAKAKEYEALNAIARSCTLEDEEAADADNQGNESPSDPRTRDTVTQAEEAREANLGHAQILGQPDEDPEQ